MNNAAAKMMLEPEFMRIASAMDHMALMIHTNAKTKGFHDFGETDAQFRARELLNIVGEISELREAERSGILDSPCDKAELMAQLGLEPLTSEEEEYADIIIRAMDHMVRLIKNKKPNRSIGEIIVTKHLYNLSRPYKHGRVTS